MNIAHLMFLLLVIGNLSFAYDGPNPLQGIQVGVEINKSESGIINYSYSISNPKSNNGEITAVDIFIGWNPDQEEKLTDTGLSHCKKNLKSATSVVPERKPVIPVGSIGPDDWLCGYADLAGYTAGSYGWGAISLKSSIKPGSQRGGFALKSPGIPAIREILIRPDIDLERLPPEYNENVEKTIALENKVKWLGKTIGPKAPPKVFKGSEFIQYLISSKEQSFTLGWIKNKGLERSLDAKLDAAKKKIEFGDNKSAKNIMQAFLNEVEAQKGKGLSSEAYALLFYNGQYLIDHLTEIVPKKSK